MSKILLSSEVELLFVRSKVCLHPSQSKLDNISGFLVLCRGPNSTTKDIKLAFIPESMLSAAEIKQFEQVDLDGAADAQSQRKVSTQRVVNKSCVSHSSGYSFNVVLSYIYSIQVRKPSGGFWYGSIVVNSKDGEKLPIMFFHDDESTTHKTQQKLRNQRMDPFTEDGDVVWGGSEFMSAVKKYINVEKSTLEPSTFLVNPELNDLRNFSPRKSQRQLASIGSKSGANTDAETAKGFQMKLPDLQKAFSAAKWKVLETVATFSARTKNQVMDMVDEHAPPAVRHLMKQPEVQRISDDFDSARVYLAKWAQQVKEEAEQSQRDFMMDDDIYNKINKELGSNELLTDEEISKTSRRGEVTKTEWDTFFDYSGRLCITVDEVKSRIFHGGLEDSLRPEAWPFLLGVYPWSSSAEERELLYKSYESAYHELKLKWVDDEEKRATEFWRDQKHRIEKDINRTDRQLDIFKNRSKRRGGDAGGAVPVEVAASDPATAAVIEEHGSSSEPDTPEDSEDETDVSNISNPHLYRMREILLTYNEYNVNLGYVQGMTDLLSPLYCQFQDEVLTFWAFTKFMEPMERNFVRDQSGMKQQMITLNKLLQFMLPGLYKHLEKCESIDLFFYFRMLLVWFKRELEWEQVNRLWEILWTNLYSGQFHLFFALAILSDNERIIVQNLRQFDEVLKYMNDLSMKLKLDPLLIRSELLFLKYKRMMDIIDRENSLAGRTSQATEVIHVPQEVRDLIKKKPVVQREVDRPEGAGGG